MTEEEAKKKWCPYAHSRTIEHAGLVSGYGFNVDTFCLGSACMAWRWHEGYEPMRSRPRDQNNERGYCGLAGEPHRTA